MDEHLTKRTEHSKNTREDNCLFGRGEYLHRIRDGLRIGRQKEVFELVKLSLAHYPDDPVFLSYYGCLLVLVARMYRRGIETCQAAIKKFQADGSCDDEALYAIFYYNLGKAYAASGKRNDARAVFRVGLSYAPGNYDMIKELRSLGMRTIKPPIPFLQRSNPLNKYIGMMLHKKNTSAAKKRTAAR